MTKEQLREESLIELAFAILDNHREPITFPHLMDEIRKLTGVTKKEMEARLLQFYTDLNIDGRFMAVNEGSWALREWYPVDQILEETAPVVKTRKKKKKASDEDDYDEEDLDVEVFEDDYEELGDEKEVVEEEAVDPDEDVEEDPVEGLEIVPDDELDINEEDDEDEDEEEDEEK